MQTGSSPLLLLAMGLAAGALLMLVLWMTRPRPPGDDDLDGGSHG